ncbi:helicase HerA domain-containing protein [Krasilnikovia sp. M28-CT-15]|uniref:helicase HerA domain-containing protein n=1 Tax=Krasilnikovia sp. M28-CT-15 TaxID=3373540 RepID=UPI00399CE103
MSALLCEKVTQYAGSLGVVVQDVPYLEATEVITGLAQVLQSVDLRIAVLTPDAQRIAEEAGIPPEKFSATVQQAEVWRNDRSLTATIVVVPFGDQARLSSLQEFETIGPAVLKGLLVTQAQAGLADTNDVLLKWWSKLANDRNISFGQLVDYYVALPSGQDDAADFKAQSSRQLPHLGLLSDPELFDSARDQVISQRVRDNRELVGRLQMLTDTDRRTMTDNITNETDPDRRRALRRSLHLLYKLRRGEPADQLTFAEASELMTQRKRRAKVDPPRPVPPAPPADHDQPKDPGQGQPEQDGDNDGDTPTPPRPGPQPLSSFAAQALLSDDESQTEDLTAARENVRSAVDDLDARTTSSRNERLTFELPSGLTLRGQVRPEVLDLVMRLVDKGRYGGWIKATVGDIEQRIAGYRGEEDLSRLWTADQIRGFLEAIEDDSGRELSHAFAELDAARDAVVPFTPELAASPLLVASAPESRELIRVYVDRYHALLTSISRVYSDLFSNYTSDADQLIAEILLLDTIVFGSGSQTIAMLTPLHPLYLWRYSEFALVVSAQRGRLSALDEKLVVESADNLPNFLTSLCLPDLTIDTPQVLPQVSTVGNLPYFAAVQERSVGDDGFPAVEKIVRAFLDAYPPARQGIRLTLIDPPRPGPYLSMLAEFESKEVIEGAHLTVLYKGREAGIQSLGLDDEDEARVAQLFRATAEDRRFTFEVRSLPANTKNPPPDTLAHVMVAFDQSGGRQDKISVVEHPIQPLAMPHRLRFRAFSKTVDLEPAPGGPFAAYFQVAGLISKTQPASRLAVRQDPAVRELLAAAATAAPWFVLADRHVDRDLQLGHLQVFSAHDGARDVVAFADDTDPFRRALREVIRQYNTAVTDSELDGLLVELTDLLDVGALALGSGLNGNLDPNQTKGLLGTLIVARWYKATCPAGRERLLISLDDKTARRWLHLREDSRRADLLGIELAENTCLVTLFEVKAMQDTSAEFRIADGSATGPATEQLSVTGVLVRDVLRKERHDELITAPARREILRENVYRELSKRSYGSGTRQRWAKAAQDLFEGGIDSAVDLHLVEVSIGVDSQSLKAQRQAHVQAGDGTRFPLTVTQLNEAGVDALEPAPPAEPPSSTEQPTDDLPPSNTTGEPAAAPPPSAPAPTTRSDSRPAEDTAAPSRADTHPTLFDTQTVTSEGRGPADTGSQSRREGKPEATSTGRPDSSSTATASVDRPQAYVGVTPGQYGKPADVYYDPQRPSRPLANGHIAITGETGSGKTQATKALMHELMSPPFDLPALILDFKDDYATGEYTRIERLAMFDASVEGLPFNPLVPPVDPTSGRATPMAHVHQLVDIIKRIYRLGDQQAYTLREAIKETYSIAGIDGRPFVPGPDQTYLPFETIREVLHRDDHAALLGRLSPIFDLELFGSETGEATQETLLDGRSVVRLSQLPGDEVKNAVAEFLLMALYGHLIRRPQPRVLRRLVVLDEAWRLVQSPYLEPLMREGRAFGVGVLIATQYPKDLPDAVSGATATRLFFSQTQADQIRAVQKSLLGKTSGSDAEQLASMVRNMPPLTCLVQNAHHSPYARTTVRAYYERIADEESATDHE